MRSNSVLPPQCGVTGRMKLSATPALVCLIDPRRGDVWSLGKRQQSHDSSVHRAPSAGSQLVVSKRDAVVSIDGDADATADDRTLVHAFANTVEFAYLARGRESSFDVVWVVVSGGNAVAFSAETKQLIGQHNLQCCVTCGHVVRRVNNDSELALSCFDGERSNIVLLSLGGVGNAISLKPTKLSVADSIECIAVATRENETIIFSVSKGGNIDAFAVERQLDISEKLGNLRIDTSKHGAPCTALFVHQTESLWIGMSDGSIVRASAAEEMAPSLRVLQYHRAGAAVTQLLEMAFGSVVWSASLDGQVVVWDAQTMTAKGVFSLHSGAPVTQMFATQRFASTEVATCDANGEVALWDVQEEVVGTLCDSGANAAVSPVGEAAVSLLRSCCKILKNEQKTSSEAPAALVQQFPEAAYIQDALLCIGDCTQFVTRSLKKLGMTPSTLNADLQNLCSLAESAANSKVPQLQPKVQQRATEVAAKLKAVCDALSYPLPECVTDPVEQLLTFAECVAEEIQSSGYVAAPGFDVHRLAESPTKHLHFPPRTPPPKGLDDSALEEVASLHTTHLKMQRELQESTKRAAAAERKASSLEIEVEDARESLHRLSANHEAELNKLKRGLQNSRQIQKSLELELQDTRKDLEAALADMDGLRDDAEFHSTAHLQAEQQQRALQEEVASIQYAHDSRCAELEDLRRRVRAFELQWNEAGDTIAMKEEEMATLLNENAALKKRVRNRDEMTSEEERRLREDLNAKNEVIEQLLQVVKQNKETIETASAKNAQRKREIASLQEQLSTARRSNQAAWHVKDDVAMQLRDLLEWGNSVSSRDGNVGAGVFSSRVERILARLRANTAEIASIVTPPPSARRAVARPSSARSSRYGGNDASVTSRHVDASADSYLSVSPPRESSGRIFV